VGSQHLHFSAKIYEQGNELTKASVVYLFYACGLLVLTINIALCHLVRIQKRVYYDHFCNHLSRYQSYKDINVCVNSNFTYMTVICTLVKFELTDDSTGLVLFVAQVCYFNFWYNRQQWQANKLMLTCLNFFVKPDFVNFFTILVNS